MLRMPITIEIKQLLLAKPALDRLAAMKFPVTTSFRLARRLRTITAEIETYEKKYNEIVTELGSPLEGQPGKIGINTEIIDPDALAADPQTKKTIINPKWTEFTRRRTELQAAPITLEIEPIRIDELQPLAAVKICCPKCRELVTDGNVQAPTLGDMVLLGPLMDDDEQPAKTSAP
jgi:hypothetical protein